MKPVGPTIIVLYRLPIIVDYNIRNCVTIKFKNNVNSKTDLKKRQGS